MPIKDNQEVAVYLLVEPMQFKIGLSIDVFGRAKTVTPAVIWEKSSAVYFQDRRAAMDCEKVLHKLFGKFRQSPTAREGGTEFFTLDCLSMVEQFVREQESLLGYSKMLAGSALEKEVEKKKSIPKPTATQRSMSDAECLARRVKENSETAQKVYHALKSLQEEGGEIMRHAEKDNILFFFYETLEQRKKFNKLNDALLGFIDTGERGFGGFRRVADSCWGGLSLSEICGREDAGKQKVLMVGLMEGRLPPQFSQTEALLKALPRLEIELSRYLERNVPSIVMDAMFRDVKTIESLSTVETQPIRKKNIPPIRSARTLSQ